MSKLIQIFFTVSLACGVGLNAQTPAPVWQPSSGHTQVPIWPGEPPDAQPVAGPEEMKVSSDSNPKLHGGGPVKDSMVAGRPWLEIANVSQPTMTVYSPKEKNEGVAVVVFPGGGYKILAIDLEGTEVADWLTSKGMTCVLLKYRVPFSGPFMDAERGRIYPKPVALEDAQRTVGLVRFHAAEWHIDPHKIGVLGFSAGGHVAAGISTHFEQRLYPIVDAADKESCRPDFAAAIFPGHLWANEDQDPSTIRDERFELRPDIHVTRQTPPTFLVQAENDDVDPVNESLAYYIALKNAGVPVEMHLYAEGGHGFGLRPTKFPITRWPQLMETWLGTLGMTSK